MGGQTVGIIKIWKNGSSDKEKANEKYRMYMCEMESWNGI